MAKNKSTNDVKATNNKNKNKDKNKEKKLNLDLDYIVPNEMDHLQILVQMRKVCGWDAHSVPSWFVQQQEKTRIMFIFFLPGTTEAIGMGGIELLDFSNGDKDVADPERKRGGIVSLFLHKPHRGQGYLGTILGICERYGRQEMGLETLTLYGLAKAGGYEKFGYKTFKNEMRNYGGEYTLMTRFLEKSLVDFEVSNEARGCQQEEHMSELGSQLSAPSQPVPGTCSGVSSKQEAEISSRLEELEIL